MTPTRRFALAVSLVAVMTVIGAAGYILIEHWSVLDAFYMSVITISTVGFGEVRPLSPAGRLFTIGLIVTGVGSAIYLFSVIGELVVEGRLREFLGKSAMNRKIHGLQGHVIVCGFGRFGRAVVEELNRTAVPKVVIEADAARQAELDVAGVMHVVGSALEDSVLDDAGIGSARAIIVATGSDADNVYINDVYFHNNLNVRLGGGNDNLTIAQSYAFGNISLDAGAGADTMTLDTVTAIDQFMANLGDGNDSLTLGLIWAHDLILLGGNGYDRLTTSSTPNAGSIFEIGWEWSNHGLPWFPGL